MYMYMYMYICVYVPFLIYPHRGHSQVTHHGLFDRPGTQHPSEQMCHEKADVQSSAWRSGAEWREPVGGAVGVVNIYIDRYLYIYI